MSVVNIPRCITSDERDFISHIKSSDSLIYSTVDASAVDQFSMDVTVGEGWSHTYSPEDANLWGIDREIVVSSNSSIVVEVKEVIKVPHNKYGIFVPTGSMFLKSGLITAAAKVEPGFSGKLKIRLVNTTKQKVVISQGTKVGSVIFWSTDTTTHVGSITRDSDISRRRITLRDKASRVMKERWVNIVPILISLLALIVAGLNGPLGKYLLGETQSVPTEQQKESEPKK